MLLVSLALIFRFMIYSELIFMCGIRQVPIFILLRTQHGIPILFIEKTIISHLISLGPLLKSIDDFPGYFCMFVFPYEP